MEAGRKCHYLVQMQVRWRAEKLSRCSVRLSSQRFRRALHVTTGTSVGTNVSTGSTRLMLAATILIATAGLTPGTNITLVTLAEDGQLAPWPLGDERLATRRMRTIMIVTTRGANTTVMMAGVRVTGRRVAGAERTSFTTIATHRSGSVTLSARL